MNTNRIQATRPEANADHGASPIEYRDLYPERGMTRVLETGNDPSRPLRKHLYIEEIPTIFHHPFESQELPLVFIACPQRHAQAVLDGALHDISDGWLNVADDPIKREDVGIMNLWLK